MNLAHRWLCSSTRWDRAVREQLLPWALDGVTIGPDVLEIGPGPGITTDVVRHRCSQLTAVEIDERLASGLRERLAGTNVTVRNADAASLPFDAGHFDTVLSFTMLHHVPSPELQDRIMSEANRVLVPGGWFAGSDSRYSLPLRLLHIGDTMVLIDPDGLEHRLWRAGFVDIEVETVTTAFRFRARKPEVGENRRSAYSPALEITSK